MHWRCFKQQGLLSSAKLTAAHPRTVQPLEKDLTHTAAVSYTSEYSSTIQALMSPGVYSWLKAREWG